jgi:predicted dehydrogenase
MQRPHPIGADDPQSSLSTGATRRQFLAAMGAGVVAAAGVSTGAAQSGRIRIGQIGTKHGHAAGKLATILKYPEVFEFVGIVEPDPERRAAVQGQAPYAGQRWMTEDELLSSTGLQAVAVETAIADLVPTAMRCLRAGVHAHVDKPAGDSLDACRAMRALAEERGLAVQMGYMFRYNPAFQFARRVVREGWLGEITEISGMIGKMADSESRREFAR